MDALEFRRFGHQVIDWIADYLTDMDRRPVSRAIEPGSIRAALPPSPPERPEPMDLILNDFDELIVPGLLHWNHPAFFGYFPANNSFPSILGELLSAGLGVNGMNWATSPAATELEELIMDWVRQACGLPEHWRGVIQDSASSSSLVALLTARERKTGLQANQAGLAALGRKFVVYSSSQAHSSVEKAVKIAGLGREAFRPVAVDDKWALDPAALRKAIEADLEAGLEPLAVVATLGTTSSTAIDPIRTIGRIAREFGLWLHVDGALGGSAGFLPEMRPLLDGLELADSYVFNAHKWLFTNFDCSLYFVARPGDLIQTFEIMPEYLKTAQDRVATNYRDWGIPLGRRFRALKLWFVIRSYGLEGLRARLRDHLDWTRQLAEWLAAADDFQVLAPAPLQTVCFRYHPKGLDDEAALNELNNRLLKALNQTGRLFLSQTKLGDRVTLRVSIGQTNTSLEHVRAAWKTIQETARGLEG